MNKITSKSGKFLDTILHGKWKKCKYYKTCEDARAENETCMHGGGEMLNIIPKIVKREME